MIPFLTCIISLSDTGCALHTALQILIKASNTSLDCSLPFAPAKAELWKVDFRPCLIKALPCHKNEPVDILPSSMTWNTYLKCSSTWHSENKRGEFLRSDPECTGVHVRSRETGCMCRTIRCSHRLSEKLLRASQLETPSPGIYLNWHLPPGSVLSEKLSNCRVLHLGKNNSMNQ